jgi:hypothetical protein
MDEDIYYTTLSSKSLVTLVTDVEETLENKQLKPSKTKQKILTVMKHAYQWILQDRNQILDKEKTKLKT